MGLKRNSWRGLELLGNEKLGFLKQFFEFAEGIPSHQTISRVFSILKPESFEDFLKLGRRRWSGQMLESKLLSTVKPFVGLMINLLQKKLFIR